MPISDNKVVEAQCPAHTVLVSAIQYGISTGSKIWHANFRCCPLAIQ